MSLVKKIMIAVLALCCSVALAAKPEMAAKVITFGKKPRPEVDRQIVYKDSTEVFMDLINTGNKNHVLIKAESPAARKILLHKSIGKKNGHWVMIPVKQIVIRAHRQRDLHLGGLHIMLIGLKTKLQKNAWVPITLVFKDGSQIKVRARTT